MIEFVKRELYLTSKLETCFCDKRPEFCRTFNDNRWEESIFIKCSSCGLVLEQVSYHFMELKFEDVTIIMHDLLVNWNAKIREMKAYAGLDDLS